MSVPADPSAADPATMDPAAQIEAFQMSRYKGNEGIMMGPHLMGGQLDLVFAGACIVLFIAWQSHSSRERKFTKWIVYPAFFLAMIVSIEIMCYMMWLYVFNYGKYTHFDDVRWLQGTVMGEAVIAILAQTYYGERAYRLLGKSKIFLVALVAGMVCELTGGVAAVVVINAVIKSLQDAIKVQPVLYVWLASQVATDMLITVTTTVMLFKQRTGWSQTDALVTRLAKFTVETALPPTVVSITYMAVFAANLNTPNLTIAFNLFLNKLYLVGLLVMVQTRFFIENDRDTDRSRDNNTYALKSSRHQQGTIHVQTETFTEVHKTAHLPVGLNRQVFDDDESKTEIEEDFKHPLGFKEDRQVGFIVQGSTDRLTARDMV